MSLSISAEREPDSVTPNPEALTLKHELMERWAPHLTLIGDFHSHSYKNLEEVKNIKGFEFSDGDEEDFLGNDYLWQVSDDQPVMMVMTICKMGKVHKKYFAESVRINVATFDVGEFRFWLNAGVGYLDDNGKRCWAGNSRSKVDLRLDAKFTNTSGDRLMGA